MSKIKTRDVIKGTIKTIDKSVALKDKMKDVMVNIKEKADNTFSSDENEYEYANSKIEYSSNRLANRGVVNFNSKGKNAVYDTKTNIIKGKKFVLEKKEVIKTKSKTIKDKLTKKVVKFKNNRKIKSGKNIVKNSSKVANGTIKNTQKVKRITQEVVKKTTTSIKFVVKATIKTVKAIIIGTKALITAIIAGGWIAIIIIILLCLIAVLFSSSYGIFFSNEELVNNEYSISSAISKINNDVAEQIKEIQDNNSYDEYRINSNQTSWKEVLAIYSVLISSQDEDVITFNQDKQNLLESIYWDTNTITSKIEEEVITLNEEEIKKNILIITINSKSIDKMCDLYNLDSKQEKQVKDLLSEEFDSLWSSVIFGTSIGSPNMVQIALSQVGNVGGQPYWSWYGFTSRVEWCAIFVSWVAEQSGYLEAGIMPKFSVCLDGVNWFKARGLWKDKTYIPKTGDIIFLDWEVDGNVNHVGIVEKVENGRVYTVEGNSTNDTCRQKSYPIGNMVIFGYGVPTY